MRSIGVLACAGACLTISAYLATQSRQGPAPMSAESLRARLEVFADDSMQGRLTGTVGYERATTFIEHELRRMRINSAGDSGTFFQAVPVHRRRLNLDGATACRSFWTRAENVVAEESVAPCLVRNARAPLSLQAIPLGAGTDFLPMTGSAFGLELPRQGHSDSASGFVDVVYGGILGGRQTLFPAGTARKIVVFFAPVRPDGESDYQLWGVREELLRHKDARAILIGNLDLMPASLINRMTESQFDLEDREANLPRTVPIIAVTRSLVNWHLSAKRHSLGFAFTTSEEPVAAPARNVVAMIEGSDPQLRTEFVVVSAHADHLGIAAPSDRVERDSVFNGADDGGSGSIALLAIAEHLAAMPTKPKRSVLFLWTVAEEQGFLGAEYFTDHPTVPRDKIVANINVDLIGHGGSAPLALYAAPHTATELSAWIDTVNARSPQSAPLAHPQVDPALCGGDEWHFTRWGIPSVRITGGLGRDYHPVTDDVSRIDFERYAGRVQLIAAIVEQTADRSTRPGTDGVKSDPSKACAR